MIVTRFSIAPGTSLHVGNARLALAGWLLASHQGGKFKLRLDDAEIGGPGNADAILGDLRWLGLDWSETHRQSDRRLQYAAAAETLKRAGRLYPCFESDEELAVKHELRLRRGQPLAYDRAMLKLTEAQRTAAEAGGKRPHWRFRLSDHEASWGDLVLGRRRVKLPALSDPVLLRADDRPHGLLTTAVDDIADGISHVIRGEERVAFTGMQLDLMAALGANPGAIAFAHLPRLTDPQGARLGRRSGAAALRSLRHDGIEPAALASYLARLGTPLPLDPMSLGDLAKTFDLSMFSATAPRFQIAELLTLNRRVLGAMSFTEAAARLPAGATEAFWLAIRGQLDLLAESRGYWDVVAGTIVPPVIEGEGDFLRTALAQLPLEPWTADIFPVWTAALRAQTGREGQDLLLPLRLALTGEEQGPDLDSLLPLIGRARAAQRLQIAAN